MNRFNWIYVSDNGKRYNVGIMHGAQSGHLLVYCNSKILLIDFEVLQDASYSFFIDEQLCDLYIEKKDNQFLYGFEINRSADTPLNRQRKKLEKKYMWQSFLLLGGFVLLVGGFVFGLLHWNSMKDKVALADELSNMGGETSATVLNILHENGTKVSYFFLVDGKAYNVEKEWSDEKVKSRANGLPVEKGDEFIVRYIPNDPKMHLIDYDRPTDNQLGVYRKRAIDKYLLYHPESDSTYADCLAGVAYQLKGLEGFADFYYQNTSPQENPQHNNQSFKRLIRDIPFQNQVRQKCELYQ
ncbi:MAG: hypothetical protein AAFP19_14985 [Bacteroidota bacterium]